ncbi:MAG: hypothetical protein Q4G24_01340 [Paracoccus sp. (in: a-proteobacteria)]|uniref:hypothetical protein n=1 Tax=Paracoccus sp. TaxID=267 RepID=UPI0026DF96EB|nr:hypothetical protein [Paracoccus sp. (in: a-proteobacteria)]MDO5620094.1 hypothetical protein [Paracoccus sp. (in: a-proteobacteria)]
MNAILMGGMVYPEAFLLDATPAQDLGYATLVTGKQSAQGPVLRRWLDGRVSIDAGGRTMTGWPVGVTPRGWWSRLTGRS